MNQHFITAIHERNDDMPEPRAFVADVVCSCARIFSSDVHSDAPAARIEAREKHAAHLDEEAALTDG